MVDARHNPYFNMVTENIVGTVEMVVPNEYTARQQIPATYDMNASLYVF